MEIRQNIGHRILNGLRWIAMIAAASALYAVFMAASSSASLFHNHDFFSRHKASS
jgi:hypothetical protein